MVGAATAEKRRSLIGRFQTSLVLVTEKTLVRKRSSKTSALPCGEPLVSLDSTQFVRDGMTILFFRGCKYSPHPGRSLSAAVAGAGLVEDVEEAG